MNLGMYTVVSRFARYAFVAFMSVAVFRAFMMTKKDARRAKKLRGWARSVGELRESGEDGAVYPLGETGCLGSGIRADVRVSGEGIRRKHAFFERYRDGFVFVSVRGAPIRIGEKRYKAKRVFAGDGDVLRFGDTEMTLSLASAPARANGRDAADAEKRIRTLSRANPGLLKSAVIAFQVLAMVVLACKTQPIDFSAVTLAVVLPFATQFVMWLNERLWPIDRTLLLLTLLLMSVSVVILKDILLRTSSTFRFHLLSMGIGLIAMLFGIAFIRNLREWEKVTDFFALFTVAFLFLTLVLGKEVHGAKNWLQITSSLTVQPSEWVKAFLVVFLAAQFSGGAGAGRICRALFITALYCVALLLEKDLGALLIYFLVTCAVFCAGTQNVPLTLSGLGAGAGGAVIAYDRMPYVAKRIEIFLDPWSDPDNKSRQITQALIAVGSGNWFGAGLGLGSPKDVPLYSSDFVFTSVAEEFGLVFSVGVLLVYVLILWRGMVIAMNARRPFHALLAFGIVFTIAIQAFVNVGGNIGLIPLTGLTLPFISVGNNSMISMLLMLGMLLGVSSLNAEDEMNDFDRLNDIQRGGKNHGKNQGRRIRSA